jgi:hypothetical protein
MAADSRSTIASGYCDDTHKLIEVSLPKPTALAVPGIGIVFSKPPFGVTNPCKWIKTAPRVMDIERFSKNYLEAHPDDMSDVGVVRLGTASLQEVRKLVQFSPDAPDAYAGNNLYGIVVASYDRVLRRAAIGVVGVRFNPSTREPEVTDHAFWSFERESRGQAFNFGLFEYVPAHVFREGRNFVNVYANFRPDQRLVKDISGEEAIAALSNLIEAAAKTTVLVPTPGGIGIGGSTDILLLGAEPTPVRVQWK